MADTSANQDVWHGAPSADIGAFRPITRGETIMIAALAFTLVAVALALPGLAVLVMLGLTEYDGKERSPDRSHDRPTKRQVLGHGGA
jgi:hypothetical protein